MKKKDFLENSVQNEKRKLKAFNSRRDEVLSKHDDALYNSTIESQKYVLAYKKLTERIIPNIDTREPDTFAFYGSAEKYYENSFSYIHNSYPYDGSGLEKIQWSLSASVIDLAVLQHEYPKESGSVNFSPAGWGSVSATSGIYSLSNNPEYVKFSGGPYVGSIIDSSTGRESSLKINPASGNTVEFWLKKNSFVSSLTKTEVIFDSHTIDFSEGQSGYGRFLLEMSASGDGGSPFYLTYMSGTVGLDRVRLGESITNASVADGSWHHYAFAVQHTGSNLISDVYVDGKYNSSLMTVTASIGSVSNYFNGTIGALATSKDSNGGIGYGKLSGSIDEFRFWKTSRTADQIGNYYDFPVNGATDKEQINSILGIYYKFNEGIVSEANVDKVVLDYSGRLNNGEFIGYGSSSRSLTSAIDSSTVTDQVELGDPIMNPRSEKVKSALLTLTNVAGPYDEYNNSSLFKTVPQWAYEPKAGSSNLESDFSILLQAIASKFDSIKLLIDGLPKIGFKTYSDFSFAKGSVDYKPGFYSLLGCERDLSYSFNQIGTKEVFSYQNLLARGTDLEEFPIVNKTDIGEYFNNVRLGVTDPSTDLGFSIPAGSAETIKSKILNSIYCNLQEIYETKGTEASFRNIIRCFGTDEKLISPNIYINNGEIILKDDPIFEDVEIKSLGLYNTNNTATLYQASTSADERHYIQGVASGSATYETKMVFPSDSTTNNTYVNTSIFGVNQVSSSALIITTPNTAGFRVSATKSRIENKGGYFKLSSSAGIFNAITSDYYDNVFNNTTWNLSVRFSEDTDLKLNGLNHKSGKSYKVEFSGHQYELDVLISNFNLSSSISEANYNSFIQANKSVYLGAERQKVTGSLTNYSEAKYLSLSVWDDYLETAELKEHAKSADNLGRFLTFHEQTNNNGSSRLKSDALALNWQFDSTTINSNILQIDDHASGSTSDISVFGPIVGYKYPAKSTTLGSSTSAVMTEDLNFVKYVPIDNARGKSRIEIKEREIDSFELDSRPLGYVYSFEKSMYQVISREMLKMLAGVSAYNNLIGEPVYKYRQEYKSLEKLRERFFRKVENEIDLERFIEYYKWLDSSLGKMLQQLQPATSDMHLGIEDVVESHALERNKYKHQAPTFEFKDPKFVGQILGINELLYDWEHGHAPLAMQDWANATATITTTGNPGNNETFTLIPALPFSVSTAAPVSFIFKTAVTTVDGTKDGDNVIIGINGATGHAASVGDRMRAAINNSIAALTAIETAGGQMTLTQTFAGKSGNTAVDMSSVATTTATDFTGGTGEFEDDNCLWWQDRAERNKVLSVTDAPNDERETLKTRANTIVSGSTYVIRKLSRPYKFSVERQKVLDLGSNRNANKNKDLYKVINSGKEIKLEKANIYDFKQCDDVINPQEERLYTAVIDTTGTSGYLDADADMMLPFSFYSSSVGTDFSNFKTELKITNNHDDHMSHLQGPFVREHVGGMPHARVKFGTADNLRPEAYILSASSTTFTVKKFDGAKSIISRGPNRFYSLANVRTNTASSPVVVGNYDKVYEIVQAHGRSSNNRLITRSGSISVTPLSPGRVSGTIDYTIPTRFRSEHIIVNMFSAPGGPETMAHGSRDLESGEFSIYNTINYRNLSVREPLELLHRERTEQFGYRKDRSAAAALASATITTTGNPANDQTFTLVESSGLAVTFVFKTGVATVDGTKDGSNVIIGINGAAGHAASVGDRMRTAIAASDLSVTVAEVSAGVMTVTQTTVGTSGNTEIDMSSVDTTTATNFSGGVDPAQASLHMTNRNYFYSVVSGSDGNIYGETKEPDNFFVQHPIPQNDTQYGWITASTTTGKVDFVKANAGFGHQHSFTTGSKTALEFLTASTDDSSFPEAKLLASDGGADDYFGYAVSYYGNTAVIGAYQDDDEGSNAGAAYIYTRLDNGTWKQSQKITASDAAANDYFGISVSIDDDLLVIGANGEDAGGSQAGAAYIFQNIAGTWTQASKIVPTTHAANDYFGFGVDVNQGSVVVGSLRINTSTGIGGAYVFQRSSKGLWQEIRHLAPSALGTADQFGYGAVAIDGKTIVAGAHFDDDQGTNAGKVYVFEASGSWSDQPTQTLTVSSTGGQKLGKPVAIHKDVIAAGALGVASDAGAVRIFEKSGTTWSHSKLLYPSDLSASDQFGFSISVYEDVVAVGAPSQNSSLGAVYIFEKINNQWKQVKKLRPHNLTAGDKFGSSVSLHQDTLYVGSYAAHGPAADQGAAYVFKKHGKSWADSNLNYAGVNLDIVESVISGSNTITPETNANIYQLNLHRHGPHGWPSWKQIRGYEHPVAKIHKKNNIFSRVFMGTPQKNKNFNNKAMFFDGNDGNASFLEINSTRTIFKNSEGFSVFTWVKHRQTDDTQSHNILVINTSAGGNRLAFGLKGTDATAYTAPGTLSLYQANGPGWQKSSYKRLDDNKWYHVGFVYNKIDDNNATAELYIDGVSQGAKFSILPLDGQMSGTDTVSIGQDYDSGPTATDFWRGYIADFAIWDIALTDAQVENLVKYSGIDSRAKGPIDLLSHSANENLKAWYRMGDGKSGNISDGILTSREDVRQNRIWNMASPGGTSLYRALPTGASASLTISIEDVSKDLPGDYSILSEQSIVKGTADSATNAGKVYFDGSENVYERARKLDVLGSVDALGLAGQKIGTYDKIRVTKNYKDIPITNRFKPVSITFHGATAPTVGTTSEQMEWFRGADPRLPQFFKRRENIQKLTQPSREHSWKLDSLYYQNLTRDVFLGEEVEISNLGKYATSFGQVAMRKTFQNDVTTFAEMQIVKDSFVKEDTRHEFVPFFNIIASDIASQYDKLIELNYIETIYPREINTFTKNSRQRENFKFHGWNSTRANRNDFLSGNIQHKSDEPLLSETSGSAFPRRISNDQKDYKKSFFGLYDAVDVTGSIPGSTSIRSNISASTWVLDSRKDLTVFPVNITSSYFTKKSAFLASRDQGTRGEGLLQNDFSTFPLGYNGLYGTPPFSLVYNRRIPQVSGNDEYLAGEAVWEAASGNLGPFYNSYEDYAFHDIRPIAQDHSIIPEFRISEFAEEVLNNERDYPDGKGMSDAQSLSYWSDFLSVTGAIYANSSGDLNVGGQFFKSYSNSDFMKYFEVLDDEIVKNDHKISHSRITLKCKAAMKFLPYRGFYPAERVTQIYELFHKNYLSEEVISRAQIRRDAPMTKTAISRYLDLRANASRFQAAKPLFGPGILMNSIKAGIAVDYPIFTGSFGTVRGDLPATGSLNSFTNLSIATTTTFTGSLINDTVDMGIPRISSSVTQRVQFEDLLNPSNIFKLNIFDNEPHPSASLQYGSKHWNKIIERPATFGAFQESTLLSDLGTTLYNGRSNFRSQMLPYSLAMQNFAAETVNFFVEDGHLTTAISNPIDEYFTKDISYKMRIYLSNVENTMYDRHSAFGPPVDDSGGPPGVQFTKLTPAADPKPAAMKMRFTDPNNYAAALLNMSSSGALPLIQFFGLDGEGTFPACYFNLYRSSAGWGASATAGPQPSDSDTNTALNVLYVDIDPALTMATSAERAETLATSVKEHFDRSATMGPHLTINQVGATLFISASWNGAANITNNLDSGEYRGSDTVFHYSGDGTPNILSGSVSELTFAGGVAESTSGYVTTTIASTSSHGYMPYVPPFLDRNANPYVEVTFTPNDASGGSKKYSAREIMDKATFEYYNFHTVPSNATQNTNYKESMSLSASLNLGICVSLKTDNLQTKLKGKGFIADHENPEGIEVSVEQRTDINNTLDRWVIQTKWETPVLDFSTVKSTALNLATNQTQLVSGSPWKNRFWDSYYSLNSRNHGVTTGSFMTGSTGMWHQKGQVVDSTTTSDAKGYFLKIEDVKLADDSPGLATRLGFLQDEGSGNSTKALKVAKAYRDQIGVVEDRKMIKEAVVAIPYVILEDSDNSIEFIKFNKDMYAEAQRNIESIERELNNVPLSDSITTIGEYQSFLAKYNEKTRNYISDSPINAIEYQLFMMKDYILPPSLDFNVSGNDPYMMYFFQFRASLDRKDISNIWQNLYPESNSSAARARYSCVDREFAGRINKMKDVSYVSHYLDTTSLVNDIYSPVDSVFNLFSPRDTNNKTRWLVFKVKERGKNNLEEIRMASVDPRLSNIEKFEYVKGASSAGQGQKKPPSPADNLPPGLKAKRRGDLQFNWPYDYFSFVELVKLDAKIDSYNFKSPTTESES